MTHQSSQKTGTTEEGCQSVGKQEAGRYLLQTSERTGASLGVYFLRKFASFHDLWRSFGVDSGNHGCSYMHISSNNKRLFKVRQRYLE